MTDSQTLSNTRNVIHVYCIHLMHYILHLKDPFKNEALCRKYIFLKNQVVFNILTK